jgi:hypothetical protein
MRGIRRVLATAVAGALLIMMPTDASANGGAYLEFDQTHYLPGDAGRAVTYVSLPARKEHLLEEGPFYVFALPLGASLRERRPIPATAVRLGTVTIEEEKDSYEIVSEFVVPELDPGLYDIGVCNDPCTISGFREALGGTISIVETRREAELLTRTDRLVGKLFGVRREARRAERRLEAAEAELETQMASMASERGRMAAEIEQLETRLAAARERAAAASGRVPFDPWVVGAILLVTLVAAALVLLRRRIVPAMSARPGSRADGARPSESSSEVHEWNGRARSGSRSS